MNPTCVKGYEFCSPSMPCRDCEHVQLRKLRDDLATANRLIDELKDKASVAAVILKRYVEGSGIPLERSVIARQLIETFEKLTEKREGRS